MINKCVICGTEFEAIRSTKKYCSVECQNVAKRIKYYETKKIKDQKKNKIAVQKKSV